MHAVTSDRRSGVWQRIGRTRLLLALLALAAYTPGFWWGVPHATAADRTNAWGVDDEPPLGPLAQAHDIIKPKAEQNPNLGYPMLHPFLVLGAFAPYMAYELASGGVQSPTVAYPHGFTDAAASLRNLTLIAHFLSVLLGVGVVLSAYEVGRTLWDERSGVAAAVAVLLIYPMFYYARNSNVDVPVLCFTAAGLAAFAHIVRHGFTMRRAIAFGTLVGLAVATKEPSFASFVCAPLVLLLLPDPGTTLAPWRRSTFWRVAVVGAVCAFAAYALGSGMAIDYRRWSAHMTFVQTRLAEIEQAGIAFVRIYPRTWEGSVQFAARLVTLIAHSMTWPGLVIGAGGALLLAVQRRRESVLALSAVGYLLVLFFSARVAQLRYVLPVAFVLAIYAARAVMLAWQSRPSPVRVGVLAVGAVAALTLVAWDVDLTYGMLRDSRYTAGAWIAEHARPGDALEYFGSEHKHPPMPASLTSRIAIRNRGSNVRADTSEAAVQTVITGWAERRPRFVVLVPDYTNPGKPYAATCPPPIYRGLEDGSLGYRRVALFETPALLPWAHRPELDHPVVNPPIRLYERVATAPAP